MTFDEILAQVLDLLQLERRLSYRAIKVRFGLDDDHLEALKDEIIEAKQLAVDERGKVLVWTGDPASSLPPAVTPTSARVPVAAIPTHLAEKILTIRHTLEGERKQVTVLFADLKDSTELIRGLDPEAAQQLLDPALHHMMDAVHRFRGHGEPGAGRRHYGPVWCPHCPRGPRPACLLCRPGHAGSHAYLH